MVFLENGLYLYFLWWVELMECWLLPSVSLNQNGWMGFYTCIQRTPTYDRLVHVVQRFSVMWCYLSYSVSGLPILTWIIYTLNNFLMNLNLPLHVQQPLIQIFRVTDSDNYPGKVSAHWKMWKKCALKIQMCMLKLILKDWNSKWRVL